MEIDAIASHGHTILHNPRAGYSLQMGCGATIAAVSGIRTVCDFRQQDVALGGQGAPLVPIGDKLLFGQYDACLNLGGIANISFDKDGPVFGTQKLKRVLITGGGVYHQFLIKRIKELSDVALIIPDDEMVNMKEALIFGFMGFLRLRDEVNVLSSVT
ncbi:unnamed protein product, partial [Cyprideis torosa]